MAKTAIAFMRVRAIPDAMARMAGAADSVNLRPDSLDEPERAAKRLGA